MIFKYDKKYLYWGITVFAVICASLAFFFLLYRFDAVRSGAKLVLSILSPFIYGLALAYLVTPIYNFFERKCSELLLGRVRSRQRAWKIARILSTVFTLFLALFAIAGVIGMILPQSITSIVNVAESMPANIQKLIDWINELLKARPELQAPANAMVTRVLEQTESWIQTDFLPNISSIVAQISNSIMGVFRAVLDLFVGLVICVYALNSKRAFAAQTKKLAYCMFSRARANRIIEDVRFTHQVFGGFIYGKLLDSLIIGVICFVCMSLMGMPYVTLISVIIGITNIIPFFGPFIGAIPTALLVLTVSPIQCVYFLIFVLILQQVDGNIIGPKILGDSTGLSSFWVIFAILMGGGLFGFPGMVLGVPLFAVIYAFISRRINHSLEKKGLSRDTDAYIRLHYVEPSSGTFVENDENQSHSRKKRGLK